MDEQIKPTELKELESYRAREAESLRAQAITAALAPFNLNAGAPAQIAALIKDDLKVLDDGNGAKTVVGPGFRPVAEVIKERLSTPEYQHFHRSSGTGGAPPLQQQQGENLGQFLMRAQLAERAAFVGPDGDPRTNLRLPLGIHPK